MTKRVAVTVEQFWHSVPGGTARATLETIEACNELARFELTGVAAWHRDRWWRSPEQPWPVPVGYHHLPRPLLYEAWLRLGWPSVSNVVGEVDLIWASAMVVPPRTAPLVATVHDLYFLDHPEYLSRRGRSFFPVAWEATKQRADLVVVPSEAVARQCRAAGLAESKIRVVPWGVRAEQPSAPMAESVRRRHNLPAQFALWVGTLEPRKNLRALVEAVSRVEGLHLAVVGPRGWATDGDDLLAPLGERAHRVGFVDEGDLRALYQAATVFTFPSLAEGFGLPVLEAMAQDTAVITSRGTATAEVAGDAAVLVDPRSVDELAAALESVMGDPARREQLVAAGRERVAAHSWRATAEGYCAVFDELTGGV